MQKLGTRNSSTSDTTFPRDDSGSSQLTSIPQYQLISVISVLDVLNIATPLERAPSVDSIVSEVRNV